MAPSIDLMINDVKRWRKILLDLEDDFAHLRTRCGGLELCEHVEMAIASLLRYCPRFRTQVDWHVGFEMWYQPFAMLVNWYLSSAGFEESQQEVLQLVDNAIHGFRSYQCPPDTARQVAKQVASMTKESFQEVDSTADWLKARECLENLTTPADTELPRCEVGNSWRSQRHAVHGPNCSDLGLGSPFAATQMPKDLHLSFIDSVDLQRGGPGRVQCMRYALAQCRADALAQKDLDLGLLKSWQHYILGRHFREHFREHDAYAKQGRERYPIRANSEQDFISVLCQADTTEPAALRAVRAYLDVCFFHPFDDGNSRLARLVFDFVLTKAGFLVQQPDMVFLFSKSAKDGEGAARLVELVLQWPGPRLMAKPKEDWNLPLQKWGSVALVTGAAGSVIRVVGLAQLITLVLLVSLILAPYPKLVLGTWLGRWVEIGQALAKIFVFMVCVDVTRVHPQFDTLEYVTSEMRAASSSLTTADARLEKVINLVDDYGWNRGFLINVGDVKGQVLDQALRARRRDPQPLQLAVERLR
ncbi:Fido domain-containing protein [Durusdinium trenchii]|uniref:Fido domain-containing protein n=1 Tax=Durusdinium trenchii TaxID=1381693 RepID=A0ABP0NVJ9_9DINO